MADNTTLNPGASGDAIRTVAKTANSPAKTQAMLIDIGGGADASPETILTAANWPLASGAAQDGTDITTPFSMPAGGVGIRGWLSAIWTKLNGTVGVTGTFWQVTQPVSLATLPALAAGANIIGAIFGRPLFASPAAITLQTATYPANTCLGGLITLTNMLDAGDLCGTILDIAVRFNVPETVGIYAVLFNANPTTSTFTDKTVVSIAAADIGKVVHGWSLSANPAIAAAGILASTYEVATGPLPTKVIAPGQTLYAAIYTAAAVTFAASSTVQVEFRGDKG